MNVLDQRDEAHCTDSFAMLSKLVLMAVSAESETSLAVSQGLEAKQATLFAWGFRDQRGDKRCPSHATSYRFFWALAGQLGAHEQQLSRWAVAVLESVRVPGAISRIGVAGKQLTGAKRVRRGETARQRLACFVPDLGLRLKQCVVMGAAAKAALKVLAGLPGLEAIPWLFPGDAAFAERP